MPPYSHSIDASPDAAVTLPLTALAPGSAKKLAILERSESSSSVTDTATTSPRKISRWRQLRELVFTLTGLDRAEELPPSGHRRRSRSLGGGSPLLLLHHDFWLEAIDTKHRYGFHLRAFHAMWKREMEDAALLDDDRNRSFFYWLDYGRGANIELPQCTRGALNATRVQYCSPQQRYECQVEIASARLAFAASQAVVQTDIQSKWIFVLSQDDTLYVARKRKGFFHHSSFLAGVPVVAAGKIYVSDGRIYAIEPHSGHFKPRLGSLTALCSVLEAHGLDVRKIHFIKPKKWRDPWPFEDTETEEGIPGDDYVSDSEES